MTRDVQNRALRGGFSLIELLIALVLGLLVTTVALNFAISVFRSVEGDKVREEVYRNSRFIGMSLGRDIQTTGVGMESLTDIGTLTTLADTLVLLHVPWTPQLAHAHEIVTPLGSSNPLPAGGTCGARCLDLQKDASNNYDLQAGDLARLQVNTQRHLILIDGVRDTGTNFQITWTADTVLFGFPAGLANGLLLDNTTTFVQEVGHVAYFEQDSVLYRSDGFDSTGVMISSPMAYGVEDWQADMLFVDGDTAVAANVTDGDDTNDFDDVLGVLVRTTLGTNRPIRVVGGGTFTRDYRWRLTPRNLMYERNR